MESRIWRIYRQNFSLQKMGIGRISKWPKQSSKPKRNMARSRNVKGGHACHSELNTREGVKVQEVTYPKLLLHSYAFLSRRPMKQGKMLLLPTPTARIVRRSVSGGDDLRYVLRSKLALDSNLSKGAKTRFSSRAINSWSTSYCSSTSYGASPVVAWRRCDQDHDFCQSTTGRLRRIETRTGSTELKFCRCSTDYSRLQKDVKVL